MKIKQSIHLLLATLLLFLISSCGKREFTPEDPEHVVMQYLVILQTTSRGPDRDAKLYKLIDPAYVSEHKLSPEKKRINAFAVEEIISVETVGEFVESVVDHGMRTSGHRFKVVQRNGGFYLLPREKQYENSNFITPWHEEFEVEPEL